MELITGSKGEPYTRLRLARTGSKAQPHKQGLKRAEAREGQCCRVLATSWPPCPRIPTTSSDAENDVAPALRARYRPACNTKAALLLLLLPAPGAPPHAEHPYASAASMAASEAATAGGSTLPVLVSGVAAAAAAAAFAAFLAAFAAASSGVMFAFFAAFRAAFSAAVSATGGAAVAGGEREDEGGEANHGGSGA